MEAQQWEESRIVRMSDGRDAADRALDAGARWADASAAAAE